jgi:tRNA(Ile)-lysidine synthetase-like protein
MEAAASAAAPEDVLAFWFGGDLDENYRTKWFPSADGDGSRQKAADERIAARFGATLRDAERGALDAWGETSPEHAVALVVVLDQFSRHVYRHDPERDEKVARCDEKAVGVVDACVRARWDARVTAPQQVFLLMPYRHTQKSIVRLRGAMERLDARLAEHAAEHALVEKFRKTTLRCLQDLEGTSYVDGDDILERSEFAISAETARTMRDTPLYRTVERFLERTLLGAVDASVAERRRPRKKNQKNQNQKSFGAAATVRPGPEEEEEEEEIEKNDRPPVVPSVGISLSGGVDSMVLAFILKAIADDPRSSFGRFGVVAMHVDYANRPESRAEATFLEDWCQRHGMDITVHRMDETLRRSNTPREEYEVITRAARYDLYKRMRATRFFPAVLVGHHAGDVRENVIANVFRGAHLLSVNGMREEGIVEGVRIWRPMLPHEKADVLDFAHTYGVPYFKDTTPAWSTRGKLRGSLQPLLAEMFGDGYARNLTILGQDSEQLHSMFESFAMKQFNERLCVSDLGAYVDLDGFQQKPMLFWKEATRSVCHALGAGAMTEKSARELVDRVTVHERRSKLRDGWITLKKTNKFFVNGTTLGAFAAGVFPREKEGPAARVSSDPNKRKNKKKRRRRRREKRSSAAFTSSSSSSSRFRRVRRARRRRERVGGGDKRRRVERAGAGDSQRFRRHERKQTEARDRRARGRLARAAQRDRLPVTVAAVFRRAAGVPATRRTSAPVPNRGRRRDRRHTVRRGGRRGSASGSRRGARRRRRRRRRRRGVPRQDVARLGAFGRDVRGGARAFREGQDEKRSGGSSSERTSLVIIPR